MGLAVAAGILTACIMRKKQTGENRSDILVTLLLMLPLSFAGARLYYCWCKPDDFTSFSQVLQLSGGGYGLLGAFAGAFIAIILSALIQRVKPGELLDACAPGIGIAIAIGRWGALFTGENLGGMVSLKLFQRLPFAVFSAGENMYRKAFFAAESLIALILTAAVIWLIEQKYVKHSFKNPDGDIFMLFTSLHFLIQGIFEQYRFDPLYFNTPYIQKLQTVPATMALGAFIGAVPLAVMILRNLFKKGFKLENLWYILACGLLFFSYFNIILRLESVSEELNAMLLILGAVGLSFIAFALFWKEIEFTGRRKPTPVMDWYAGQKKHK